MGMTMTQKILAAHAGLDHVTVGQLIEAKLDIVLGNDITTPVAINEFKKAGFDKVFDKDRIAIVLDHFVPNKDIKAAEQSKQCREFACSHCVSHFYDVGKMGIEHALLPEQGVVSADGRMVSASLGLELQKALGSNRILRFSEDLVDTIWTDRPPMRKEPVYILEEQYAGQSAREKIAWLRSEMSCLRVDVHLISALDQIAWLLNIRGADVANNPVTLSYLVAEQERLLLFIDGSKLSHEVEAYLAGLGVELYPYDVIAEVLPDYFRLWGICSI